MKPLLRLVLLAIVAVLAAMLLKRNLGDVVFLVPPHRVDLSMGLLLLAAMAVLWLSFRLGRLLQRAADFPDRVRTYRERRTELGAHRALYDALRALLEGRFLRAERAARDAQTAPQVAGMAALIGARAAHRMQEYERRDRWLEQAEADPELATARLVVSAELWAEQRHPARALRAIDALQSSGARHLHAMRIALASHVQAGHWREVMRIVRSLEKRRALNPEAADRVRRIALQGLLADTADEPEALQRVWDCLDLRERLMPEVALDAARRMNRAGHGRSAALALEGALEREWDERLLEEYARCVEPGSRATIERAEAWLKAHPRSRPLLRALARICLRERLWGKARAYLEECQRLGEDPQTSLAYAELEEALGDEPAAARHFRQAALGMAQQPPAQAPQPTQDTPGRPATLRREATW